MNEANYCIFVVSVLRRKSGVYIFWKYLKETKNGILKGGKTLRERILKNISLKTHYAKDNLEEVCKK